MSPFTGFSVAKKMGRLRLMAEIDQEEQISYNAIGAC